MGEYHDAKETDDEALCWLATDHLDGINRGCDCSDGHFVATSSCITCHARASVGAPSQGQNGFPVPPPLSVFTDRGESHNGPVDPSWYWDETAAYSSPPAAPEALHKSLEFLWQLAFGPKARATEPDAK